MDESKAASIVSLLADGVHPLTGEVFPQDSPYQSPEVIRALYVACRALELRSAAVARKRSDLPPNTGKPWKDEDDRRLLAEFDQGRPLQELAKVLGRTIAGVQVRLEKHGRVSPDQSGLRTPAIWRRPAATME